MVSLCLPAEARVTIGVAPVEPLSGKSQATIDLLGEELENSAGTVVTVRLFDNDAALSSWLLRFREIDAAIVAPEYIKRQPAGTLKHLADLHAKNSTAPPLALVVRRNLNNSQVIKIKEAFLKLDTSDNGLRILKKLGLAGITVPGKTLKRKEAKPAPLPAKPVKKKVVTPTEVKPKPARQLPKKAEVSPDQPEKKQQEPTATKKQLISAKVATPETTPKVAVKTPAKPVVTAPDKRVSKTEVPPEPIVQEPVKPEVKQEEPARRAEPKEQFETKQPIKEQAAPAETPKAKTVSSKRLTLFIALIILVAILIKTCLVVLRWQSNKKPTIRPEAAPDVGIALEREEIATPDPTPSEMPIGEELIIEAGQLGPGKVPALLKRCADLPEPVVLQVTKGACEKLVYFAGGQVSGALTRNASTSESGVRWNKLGNLLIREGLLSREERDQGMALVTKEPGLRFGEALLKLGLIDLAGLRHALTRQAKVTVYSLMLFHEGRYQVFAGDASLPPEESVSLEVINLIREASHHQSEWTAIRQALPNLNTALDFRPEGRSKLENVSLSSQQEETLSLIDGKRTINDLCAESAMMDYELYRFLYLMVNAGVLE